MARYKPQDGDAFLDEDVGQPNLKAQYRGYRFLRGFILGAGILAVIFGLMEGAKNIFGAFTSFSSLLERAAWLKFLTGLGTITEVGLLVVVVALLWRWRSRRASSKR